jgi:hypothetical protein
MMAATIQTAQKVEAKQKAALAQQAIPDEILEGMVSELKGDKKLLLKKARVFRAKNADKILFARHLAEKGLLKQYGVLPKAQKINDVNANAFSEVTNIIDTASALKEMLSKIPDPSKSPEAERIGLPLRFEIYIYESALIDEAENRLEAWAGFINLLDYHITVFNQIKSTIAPAKKMGAPVNAGTLKAFIEIIAKMYQEKASRSAGSRKNRLKVCALPRNLWMFSSFQRFQPTLNTESPSPRRAILSAPSKVPANRSAQH